MFKVAFYSITHYGKVLSQYIHLSEHGTAVKPTWETQEKMHNITRLV